MADPIKTTNASWADAWLDGYAKGSDGQPDNAPDDFTPASRTEWVLGWKAGDLDRQVAELGIRGARANGK